MTPRLSGHFSIFGLVFFVLNSLLGIARQWSRNKFAFFFNISNVGYWANSFSKFIFDIFHVWYTAWEAYL